VLHVETEVRWYSGSAIPDRASSYPKLTAFIFLAVQRQRQRQSMGCKASCSLHCRFVSHSLPFQILLHLHTVKSASSFPSLNQKSYFTFCLQISANSLLCLGARGNAVGWGTRLQAGRSRVQVPMRSLDIFNLPNPSSQTTALGSTQPLTEMSTRNILGGKGRPARKADNLPIV
jgi:hypothetical protein